MMSTSKNTHLQFGKELVSTSFQELTVNAEMAELKQAVQLQIDKSRKFSIEFDDYEAPVSQVVSIFKLREKRARKGVAGADGVLESLGLLQSPKAPSVLEVLTIVADDKVVTVWIDQGRIWAMIYRDARRR